MHSQEDGVILAVCATGSSSRDSVLSWIRFLEDSNPRLGKDISVLFTLKSPIGPTDNLEIEDPPQDSPEPQRISSFDGRPQEPESKKPKEPHFGYDPSNPDLSQVGVDESSDSRFPNWPHHFNRSRRDTEHRDSLGSRSSRKSKSLNPEDSRHLTDTSHEDPNNK